jgi:spartin
MLNLSFSFSDPKQTLAKGFIRVGNWMYPLNPERTTAMKTNYNAFIFPNSGDEEESNDKINCKFVGVMFNDAVDGEIRNTFEDVLNNFAIIIEQQQQARQSQISSTADRKIKEDVIIIDDDDEKTKEGTAEYLSRNLVNGAKYINRGVTATTEFTNKYLNIGGEKLKSQIKPNETESKVDPTVKKCTEGVRYGTNLTVKVSGFLVDKLGLIATKTAKTVAPYLKVGATKILTKTGIVKNSNDANQYLENVCTVASGSVVGFSLVYESLENAAKALAKTIAENSVEVVKHKYGDEAGKVTENTLYSAGNIAISANNVRNLKITKTIAKAAVKETVNSFSTTKNEDKNKKN